MGTTRVALLAAPEQLKDSNVSPDVRGRSGPTGAPPNHHQSPPKRTGPLSVAEPADSRTAAERVAAIGLPYRRFDWWVTKGYIKANAHSRRPGPAYGQDLGTPNAGSGNPRYISDGELAVLRLMVDLVDLGMLPAKASELARRILSEGEVSQGYVRLRATFAEGGPR
jgi:hypothetical protein